MLKNLNAPSLTIFETGNVREEDKGGQSIRKIGANLPDGSKEKRKLVNPFACLSGTSPGRENKIIGGGFFERAFTMWLANGRGKAGRWQFQKKLTNKGGSEKREQSS